MKIQLSKLDTNPHRDLDLYPIRYDQVESLVDSIKELKFWGGVTARPSPDASGRYQIGGGHHRIEAAKQSGMKKAEVFVADYTDEEMLKLMVAENMTQMGCNAAACLDSVAAISRWIAEIVLLEDWECLRSTTQTLFGSERAFVIQRGKFLKGEGLGRDVIRRFSDERLSRNDVGEALATLKASGHISEIIDELQEQIESDPKQSEETKEDAETAKTNNKAPRIFDDRVAKLFARPAQLSAFRRSMTTKSAQHYFPVKQHRAMAGQMISDLTPGNGNVDSITIDKIGAWVRTLLQQAISAQKAITEEEARQQAKENAEQAIDRYCTNMSGSMRSTISYTAKIADLLDKYPDLNTKASFTRVAAQIDNLNDAVKALRRLFK